MIRKLSVLGIFILLFAGMMSAAVVTQTDAQAVKPIIDRANAEFVSFANALKAGQVEKNLFSFQWNGKTYVAPLIATQDSSGTKSFFAIFEMESKLSVAPGGLVSINGKATNVLGIDALVKSSPAAGLYLEQFSLPQSKGQIVSGIAFKAGVGSDALVKSPLNPTSLTAAYDKFKTTLVAETDLVNGMNNIIAFFEDNKLATADELTALKARLPAPIPAKPPAPTGPEVAAPSDKVEVDRNPTPIDPAVVDSAADAAKLADAEKAAVEAKLASDALAADALKAQTAADLAAEEATKLRAASDEANRLLAAQGKVESSHPLAVDAINKYNSAQTAETKAQALADAALDAEAKANVAAIKKLLADTELAKLKPGVPSSVGAAGGTGTGGTGTGATSSATPSLDDPNVKPVVNPEVTNLVESDATKGRRLAQIAASEAELAASQAGASGKWGALKTTGKVAAGILSVLTAFMFHFDLRPVQEFLSADKLNHVITFSCDKGIPSTYRVCNAVLTEQQVARGECPGEIIPVGDYCSNPENGKSVLFEKAPEKDGMQGYTLFLFNPDSGNVDGALNFWKSIFRADGRPLASSDLASFGTVESKLG